MIQVTDLRKAYGSTVAVDGVSFETHAGETFGLLGPNGAGKTTTLRVLSGLLAPSEGSVRVAGLDVGANPAAVRRVVGYLPDDFGVYDDLRIYNRHLTEREIKMLGALDRLPATK